ncbi:hypothetical protein CLU92_0005 [Janthinobacterium sp. 61]|nr:hypothetical protein CLU92_0005 [Janthinobacterium sp. 61]
MGGEANALAADVNAKQVQANTSAASAAASVDAATAQVAAAQAARDAAVVARIAAQAAASDAQQAATGTVLIGTSTTSLVIGTGNKTLTTQSGKQYAANIFITAVSASDPTRFMSGTVVSYSGTTLVIAVTAVGGSGATVANWNISVTGAPGAAAIATLAGNATGAINLLNGTAPAASATPDIWAAGGNRVPISSGTPITGFPTAPQAGAQRTLVAAVAFSMTSGANLVIAGGSTAVAIGDEVDVTAETPTLFKVWVRRVTSASGASTGDTLTTARVLPTPDWLKCDGADYLASSYPELAGLLGPARSFAKLADPATLPAGAGGGVAYSADGVYLAIAHNVTPFISVYKLTAGVYVKLAALPAAPGLPRGLAISPDGVYLAACTVQSPYLTLWKRTGDTFASYAFTGNLSSAVVATTTSVAFSPNGQFFAVGNTPVGVNTNLYIHTYSGGVFSQVASMGSASLLFNGCQAMAFSPDGTHLVASGVSAPFMAAWSISGNTFTNTPTFSAQTTYSGLNATYSSDSKYLAVGLFSINGPGLAVYKRSGNAYTKLPNPAGAPEGYGSGTSFSPDTGQLAVATSAAPYLLVFRRSGDQFILRSDMPSTTVVQTLSQASAAAFSPVGSDLACSSTNTPFLQVFRETVDATRVRVPNLPAADTLVASYIKT